MHITTERSNIQMVHIFSSVMHLEIQSNLHFSQREKSKQTDFQVCFFFNIKQKIIEFWSFIQNIKEQFSVYFLVYRHKSHFLYVFIKLNYFSFIYFYLEFSIWLYLSYTEREKKILYFLNLEKWQGNHS